MAIIDEQGFRANVGIIVANTQGQLLWCRRQGTANAWQFPQGGLLKNESPRDGMYRELAEELGLLQNHVKYIGETKDWFRYRLPEHYIRRDQHPLCYGQKQKWFLLQLLVSDDHIQLDSSQPPEFEAWRWVSYWRPAQDVVYFKQAVYQKVLQEFEATVKWLVCD